jgi:chloramphenicol 3-O-phosphotransferase
MMERKNKHTIWPKQSTEPTLPAGTSAPEHPPRQPRLAATLIGQEANRYIIVSGVPASGKSTVARLIARELALPVLDKDDFLESMFEDGGSGDAELRRKFSRLADQELRNQAERSNGAIIASWWKHPLSSVDSGTRTDWLASLPGTRVEVHCCCSPGVAARRFAERQRHPGHLDSRWSYAELLTRFTQDASLGPLGIGRVVKVQTDCEVELGALMDAIIRPNSNQPNAPTGPTTASDTAAAEHPPRRI